MWWIMILFQEKYYRKLHTRVTQMNRLVKRTSLGIVWLYNVLSLYQRHQILEHAERIAAFMLNHPNMPKDLVPYWDYNAPNIPNEERDASAAAILASGLYELSLYS
jgi:hypothetical protein